MRLRFLIAFFATASLAQLLAAEPNPLPQFTAKPDEEMNALFQRREGWIGADGNYSVPLGQGKTLWLFSDTWVGKIDNGKRVDATIVNNSAAIQEGVGREAKVRFFVRREPEGKPAALITPADGRGWFWLQSAIRIGQRLYLFLAQIERTGDPGVFGFRGIGQWLAAIDNPDAEPAVWRIKQQKLPFALFSPKRELNFGTAVVHTGDNVFVFGTDDHRSGGAASRHLVVARVPAGKVADFSAWRFLAEGDWAVDADGCQGLFDGMATEGSVTFLPRLNQYVCVYSEAGLSPNILARTAEKPEGPWSEPVKLYTCPETGWDKNIFCYSAKAHPELCGDDELLITYAANSFDFGQAVRDSRLYWPKFVRVKFEATR